MPAEQQGQAADQQLSCLTKKSLLHNPTFGELVRAEFCVTESCKMYAAVGQGVG